MGSTIKCYPVDKNIIHRLIHYYEDKLNYTSYCYIFCPNAHVSFDPHMSSSSLKRSQPDYESGTRIANA